MYDESKDRTPFGAWGDHCPFCGRDWKRPHDEECERVVNPANAAAILAECGSW